MNILTVCVSVLSFVATMTHSAPLLGVTALVDQEQFQDLVQKSHSLIQKILSSIPAVHNSSVLDIKNLQLKSPEKTKWVIMASNLGIPQAPGLRVVSENCTVETCLSLMTEGLQLHQSLINAILPKLSNDKMTELSNDVRDLGLLVHQMLKLIQKTTLPSPTHKPVVLRLRQDYDVQVAAHLILEQLQEFGQDVVRCLRSMEQSDEEELEL